MRRISKIALLSLLTSACGDLGHGTITEEPSGSADVPYEQLNAVRGKSGCRVEPNPVRQGGDYTIGVSGMPRNARLVVAITNRDGETSVEGTSDARGTASFSGTATVLGAAEVSVSIFRKRGARVAATCSFDVISADAAICGDGVCEAPEDCNSCESDCGACPPVCGDGVCEAPEDCMSCESDCGACPPTCGDGVCEAPEDCMSCESDCGVCAPTCGDGVCEAPEDCMSCESDCGACPPTCGDGVCEAPEDCMSCESDCGACPPTCGDGVCEAPEDCMSCESDCGVCPPVCGDGVCEAPEDCMNCESDCGTCPNDRCEPAINTSNSGRHKAGENCRRCHDGSGKPPFFSIAGTLYDGINSSTPVVGATIHIIDARGRELKLTTYQNGNFYSRDSNIVFPVTTFASRCPDVQDMSDPVSQSGGGCNSCHTSGDRIHLP